MPKPRWKVYLIIGSLLGLSFIALIHNKKSKIVITDDFTLSEDFDIESHPKYAIYQNGTIYICHDVKDIDYQKDDIVILDLRDEKEDICIRDSYRLDDISSQEALIQLIIDYNKLYPSQKLWQRSEESLLNEWLIHNLAYKLNISRERTSDVDFENKEENKYLILQKNEKY